MNESVVRGSEHPLPPSIDPHGALLAFRASYIRSIANIWTAENNEELTRKLVK